MSCCLSLKKLGISSVGTLRKLPKDLGLVNIESGLNQLPDFRV